MKIDVAPLMYAIEAFIQKADNDLEDQLDEEGYVAPDKAVDHIEELSDLIQEVLDKHTDELLERLEKATGIDNFREEIWPTIKDEKDLEEALKKILKENFDTMLREFTAEWMLREDKALVDERITKPSIDFIESWSADLAEIMHLNTNSKIENILTSAVKDQLSVAEVAQKIGESSIRQCGWRCRRVAITEVLRMESYSQLEYMRQDPAVELKVWFHTGAEKNKPRENHVAISGQEKPVEEPFDLTGADGAMYHPMCPRDTCLPASESVNCHCIMTYKKNKKILGMTDDERKELRKKYMDQIDEEWENGKGDE